MATTETPKTDGDNAKTNGRTRSTAQKAGDAKRSATQRSKRASPRSNSTRRAAVRKKMQDVPTWATALASVVSVGVAVGVGLFATRKQWLPQAEEWGEQLQDKFGKGQNDDDDYFAEGDSDDWESPEPTTAGFPGASANTTIAGAI